MARLSRRGWQPGDVRIAVAALAACAVVITVTPAHAQVAAPGDVYYKIHVDQRFKYYAFVNDFVTWENRDLEGTAPLFAAAHESLQVNDLVSVSSSFSTVGGRFSADLDSQSDQIAGTGLFHQLYNSLRVDVYIKGNTGTPFHILIAGDGQIEASRLGGLPGTIQQVNGVSTASFIDSTASVNYTGSMARPVYEARTIVGFTSTQIVVGADTYSLATGITFATPTSTTQAVCILGCMQAPATFHARGSGHIEMEIYPCQAPLFSGSSGDDSGRARTDAIPCAAVPTDAHARPAWIAPLRVSAAPNPFNPATVVSFAAPAGQAANVDVFDARGRWQARIYAGKATGQAQSVVWHGAGLPSGMYVVRVASGGRVATEKLVLLQ